MRAGGFIKMEICKSHKECFEKVCSLCEDYESISSYAMLDEVQDVGRSRHDYGETHIYGTDNSFAVKLDGNTINIPIDYRILKCQCCGKELIIGATDKICEIPEQYIICKKGDCV